MKLAHSLWFARETELLPAAFSLSWTVSLPGKNQVDAQSVTLLRVVQEPCWDSLTPQQFAATATLCKPNIGEGSFLSYHEYEDLLGAGTTPKANSVIYSKIKAGRTMNMKRG